MKIIQTHPIGSSAWSYIHLFKWPANRQVELTPIKAKITKAFFLSDAPDIPLRFEQTAECVRAGLPEKAPDVVDSVLCLVVKADAK